jgi:hypothetical protein
MPRPQHTARHGASQRGSEPTPTTRSEASGQLWEVSRPGACLLGTWRLWGFRATRSCVHRLRSTRQLIQVPCTTRAYRPKNAGKIGPCTAPAFANIAFLGFSLYPHLGFSLYAAQRALVFIGFATRRLIQVPCLTRARTSTKECWENWALYRTRIRQHRPSRLLSISPPWLLSIWAFLSLSLSLSLSPDSLGSLGRSRTTLA